MNQTKKRKLKALLGTLDTPVRQDVSGLIKSALSEIKQPRDYSDNFLKLERVIQSKKFDRVDFSSVLKKIDDAILEIKNIRIPKTDMSALTSAILDLSLEVRNIPKYHPIDYSKDIDGIKNVVLAVFGSLMSEIKSAKPQKDEAIYKEVNTLKESVRGLGRGGSMYQAWQEDTTANSTLSGTIDGSNKTFTLKYKAVNGIVFLFRNGVLESLADYSVGVDNKTITYTASATAPQVGDTIQAKYPR